jgi:uncharacterized membrane protein
MPDEHRLDTIYAAFFDHALPADLKIALAWLAASIMVIYLPVLNESPIRVVLALPGILFLPGYCLIAALFIQENDIDLIERVALSFGLSIAVVPLIGLLLNFTPFGIRLDPIVISLTIFSFIMVLIAHYRRALLPPEDRFRVPFLAMAGTLRDALVPSGGNRVDRILSVLLIVAVLAAVITTVFVIAVPKEGERFSEFFLLGEKQKAADYPTRITVGQSYPLYLGVGNHEYETVTYTVESWSMDEEYDSMTNSSRIMAMDPLWQHSFSLAHNETTTIPYNLSLAKTGYNRVEFLLFKENVPGHAVSGRERINASYRDLNLWLTVRTV